MVNELCFFGNGMWCTSEKNSIPIPPCYLNIKNEKQQIKKEKTHSAIQHLDKLLWPNTAINYFLIPEIVIGFLIFQNVCELKNLLR